MHFRRWGDGVRFWPLQHRELYYFVVILRWFYVDFAVILYDFGHPSRSLLQVYEWSSEHVKIRNFYHFLKRFWSRKNRALANVWWISWKINIKLFRKKELIFEPSVYLELVFSLFSATSKKTWLRWRFVSVHHKISASGSPQKWSKNDASKSVDAFGGVRNGHRIRGAGGYLFFHIVKYTRSGGCA